MIDLSKHIQEGARLELEALELSTDECSFMSAQNSAQAMQIDELKRDLAAAKEARQRAEDDKEMLRQTVKALDERAQRAEALAESYRLKLHEIREEWAGAECGEPVTAQEAYAIHLAKRMYELAAIAGEKP